MCQCVSVSCGTIQVSSYCSAILLIRNPLDAMVADWSRKFVGHTGGLKRSHFGEIHMVLPVHVDYTSVEVPGRKRALFLGLKLATYALLKLCGNV